MKKQHVWILVAIVVAVIVWKKMHTTSTLSSSITVQPGGPAPGPGPSYPQGRASLV